jgi:D-ornithine 4,5-aminomutase subunit alpha
MQERADDFASRRTHLAGLSEDQLKERFWELADQLTEPLIELARTHTSPSIERSVLLRMGFSSIEARAIVEQTIDHDLMGKGAGHVVFRVAAAEGIGIREAGLALAEGRFWSEAAASFTTGEKA